MSIQIPTTQKEMRSLGRILAKEQSIVCIDDTAYLKMLLIAQYRIARGLPVKATIVKPSDAQ